MAVHSKSQVRFPGRPSIETPSHLADEHRIYLKAHILSKGLILVDLPGEWNTSYIVSLWFQIILLMIPGLRDLNTARLKITERYVLNCDEIFAVCYIGRATTDAGVKGVFKLAKRAELPNIGIICTKSDVSTKLLQ